MAAGMKILSMMMSLIIVSISEITPWVFSNDNASANSVILDAACFDSVLSVSSEAFFAEEPQIIEAELPVIQEETPEIITEAPVVIAEETTLIDPELIGDILSAAVSTVIVTEEAIAELINTTEPETSEVITEPETEAEETTETVETGKILIGSDSMLWPVAHKSEVVEGFPRYSSSGRPHHGVDIFVFGTDGSNRSDKGTSLSYGKPFRAAQSGVVVEAANDDGWNTGYGNYCVIDHGDGTQTLYAHAKDVYVQVGDKVTQGQTIGEIGGTGNTTSPHLHFEVRVYGERVNPLNYVSEPER